MVYIEQKSKLTTKITTTTDLLPRLAKKRQTVAENATHGMWRTSVWRGEKSPCENTKKSPFGGFSRGAFLCFCPENTLL